MNARYSHEGYVTATMGKTPFNLPPAPEDVEVKLSQKAQANLAALEKAKAENPAFPALALALRERLRTEGRIRKQHNGGLPNTSEALEAARAAHHAKHAETVARIERIMPNGPTTSTELSEITGLSKSTIRRALMDLMDAGKVVSIAKGRGHKAYVLVKGAAHA